MLVTTPLAYRKDETPIQMEYTNWKGVTALRTIIPRGVVFKVSEWHGKEPVWILNALDVDKGEEREFCMKDIQMFV